MPRQQRQEAAVEEGEKASFLRPHMPDVTTVLPIEGLSVEEGEAMRQL